MSARSDIDDLDLPERPARIVPLGDRALIVRFDNSLSEAANRRAIAASVHLENRLPRGVLEICPSLVSVLIRYDPMLIGFEDLAAHIRLALSGSVVEEEIVGQTHEIAVLFGGEGGPDLEFVAGACRLSVEAFIETHNRIPLRVLATGFAPGFVYCGMHRELPEVPRRTQLHAGVGPGSVLFAAGQTAITATAVPTGWHVIGRTGFINFDPRRDPPTALRPGDLVRFVVEGVK